MWITIEQEWVNLSINPKKTPKTTITYAHKSRNVENSNVYGSSEYVYVSCNVVWMYSFKWKIRNLDEYNKYYKETFEFYLNILWKAFVEYLKGKFWNQKRKEKIYLKQLPWYYF